MIGQIWSTILFQPIHNTLVYLYTLTGSLGLSVVIVILIIRFLLTPLIVKQYADTQKLLKIRPKLQEIQDKHKNAPKELQKAQADLYKEIGYNPIGCLINIVVQLPVVIALYQSVISFTTHSPATMPDLYPFVQAALNKLGQATFNTNLLGIVILESPAKHIGLNSIVEAIPYIILLILLALSNFIPTWINMKYINPQPKPVKKPDAQFDDPDFAQTLTTSMNSSFLYIMPITLTISMYTLPSIITIYLILQNIIGTSQQLIVKYVYDRINKNKNENKAAVETTVREAEAVIEKPKKSKESKKKKK